MRLKLVWYSGLSAALLLLGSVSLWEATAKPQQTTPGGAASGSALDQIDARAERAKTGTEQELRDLTGDLLSLAPALSEVGNSFDLKERVAAAEVQFRRGNHRSIREDELSDALNGLATRLSLPPFGHTSKNEVRRVRMRLVTVLPKLMSSDAAAKEDGTFEAVSETMSPLQAAFTAAVLIQQKLHNPDFQETDQEHEANKRNHAGHQPEGERSKQIQASIQQSATQTSLRDMLGEADAFLTAVGIEPLSKGAK